MDEELTPQRIMEISESEWAAFKTLWKYMDKRSFLSELFLRDFYNGPYFLNCFAHVLSKAKNKYPHFRYYLRNIVLLSPGEHTLLDHGTIDQRDSYSKKVKAADWSKIAVLKESLVTEYSPHVD